MKRRTARRLFAASLLGALLLPLTLQREPESQAFDIWTVPANPDTTLVMNTGTYKFDANLPPGTRNRIDDAAEEWSDNTEGMVSYSNDQNSDDWIKLVYMAPLGLSSMPCYTGLTCSVKLNMYTQENDEFYWGTGHDVGVSSEPPYLVRSDGWGVVTHEFGHWLDLYHGDDGCTSLGLISPGPEWDYLTMCFPSTAYADRYERWWQRSLTMSEKQAMRMQFDPLTDRFEGWFQLNYGFEDCEGGGEDCIPDYWRITAGADHTYFGASNKKFKLIPTTSYPNPEIWQEARGKDVDEINSGGDGRFRIRANARVRVDWENTPTATLFVRAGTYEDTCVQYLDTDGDWTIIDSNYCTGGLDFGSNSEDDFSFGIRVNERISFDWIKFLDK